MSDPEDPSEDPNYQAWLEELAKQCRCNPGSLRPCDGLMAGGMCDGLDLTEDREGDDYDE